MKVNSEREVQSGLTLCDPMDCSLTGSSAHGNSQTRVLEWGAITFSDYLYSKELIINYEVRKVQYSNIDF